MDSNAKFNQISTELSILCYRQFGMADLSSNLEVTLEFDEQQRVSKLVNLKVDGLPKMSSFEFMTALNKKSQEFLSLPGIYLLKSLGIEVKPGGHLSTTPVYLKN